MGKIKKLKFKNVNAFPADWSEIDLYPVTHIAAVFDDDGNTLEDLLNNYIGEGSSERGGNFDLIMAYKVTPTNEMPDLNREEQACPPSGGWDTSTNDAIGYVWVTYAKMKDSTTFNQWSDGYIWTTPVCIGTITPSVKSFFAYIFAVGTNADTLAATLIQEDGKAAGSYDFVTNTLTVPPEGGWVTSHSELSPNNENGEYIYYTYRTFYSDGSDTYWYSPPMKYITSSIINTEAAPFKSVQGVIFTNGRDEQSVIEEKPLFTSEGVPLGSYDFAANNGKGQLTPPPNWQLSPTNVICGEGESIFYTWRMFFEDGTIYDWYTPPLKYITSATIIADSATNSASFGVEAYIAVAINSNIPQTPSYQPNTLTTIDPFNFAEGQLVKYPNRASQWYASPQLAIEAYATKYESDHQGEADVNKKKTACVVYVSYNNYIADYIDENWQNPKQTGWSSPVKYIDIDGILNTAEENASRIASDAIANSQEDFNNALDRLTQNSAVVEEVLNSVEKLYSWTEVSQTEYDAQPSTNKLTGTYANLEALNSIKGANYAGKYVRTSDGKYYSYTITSTSVTTQVSRLETIQNEQSNKIASLYTTVNQMTPDNIRLQASKGNFTKVCWTNIGKYTSSASYKKEVNSFNELPGDSGIGTTFNFGDIYRVRATETAEDGTINNVYYLYRADYATSTGFLNILNDNLHFGITQNTSTGENNKAIFNMYFGDNGSTAELTAQTIVLNGDTIADAIAAKYLNIDNFTYLFNKTQAGSRSDKAMAIFGAGTSGTAQFNSDGSGWLAGGLIKWGNGIGTNNSSSNFGLSVSGHIEAHSGYIGNENAGWTIGVTEDSTQYPALLGTSLNGNRIVLSTEYIASTTTSSNSISQNWWLNKDGTGSLAKGNISWTTDGTLTIKGDFACSTLVDVEIDQVTKKVPAWKLSNDGNAQIGGDLMTFDYNSKVLSIKGDINARQLKLGIDGAEMNFVPYDPTIHGVATNGFSYIDKGEPILFGKYNDVEYCVPLLKMGTSTGVTYQECKMVKISNDNMTAESLAGTIIGTSYRTTLYRVKEGSKWIYRQNSIEGSTVTGTYVSYIENSSPREVYRNGTSSHFSTAIYTGQNDQYKIRVFIISNGEVTKAYDTYIAKQVSISMNGSFVAGSSYQDYTVSNTWEYLNALGPDGQTNFLFCSSTGSTLSNAGPQALTGLLTSRTVITSQTLSGAYNENVGAIVTDSRPFNTLSGGIEEIIGGGTSGGSSSVGTSAEVVGTITPYGSTVKTYSCSAFNTLLYSDSAVNAAHTSHNISIDGVIYTIKICTSASLPTIKDEHTIYLVKE